MNQVK